MAAAGEHLAVSIGQTGGQFAETLRRNEQVTLAGQDVGRGGHARQAGGEVEPLDEMQAVGHDALVRLPALSGDELEQRARLATAEKQVEELIDERAIGWQ